MTRDGDTTVPARPRAKQAVPNQESLRAHGINRGEDSIMRTVTDKLVWSPLILPAITVPDQIMRMPTAASMMVETGDPDVGAARSSTTPETPAVADISTIPR